MRNNMITKTKDIIDTLRQQTHKLSAFGKKSIEKIEREPVEKLDSQKNSNSNDKLAKKDALEGEASQRDPLDPDYQDIQQLFRHQFPIVSRQLLGKRYNTIDKVSRFVLPNGLDQASDELLKVLGNFASHLAATETVLEQAASKNIEDLQKDTARSARVGNALKEINKLIAAVQGSISGATGLVGAAADLPISVILSLKTIYEIGHAYGFELDHEEDRQAVYAIFSQSDLGLIAEKQTIFLGLTTLKTVFETGDFQQLQGFLSTNHSVEQFQNYLTDMEGNYKWPSLNAISKIKVLKYALPVIGGAAGAVYNIRLIEEVSEHANEVFSKARDYLNQHQDDQNISVLEAYHQNKDHQSIEQKDDQNTSASNQDDVSPLLSQDHLNQTTRDQNQSEEDQRVEKEHLETQAEHAIEDHPVIEKVEVQKRHAEQDLPSDEQVDADIEKGIAELAKENISATQEDTAEQQDVQQTDEVKSDSNLEEDKKLDTDSQKDTEKQDDVSPNHASTEAAQEATPLKEEQVKQPKSNQPVTSQETAAETTNPDHIDDKVSLAEIAGQDKDQESESTQTDESEAEANKSNATKANKTQSNQAKTKRDSKHKES